MKKVKQIEIKNQTYYFYNDIINLKNFESNLLKIDKNITKVFILQLKIGDCENIHCVNLLYLVANYASGYFEEKNGNKYLIFDDSVNESKWLLKKQANIWDGIKNEIKAINDGKENDCGKKNDYRKDYMKIKFNSNDDLPLNKPLKFHVMTIIVRSVFEEGGQLYPQVFLDDCLYQLEEWE